ncbi:MAG TPA: HAMP domain-containing sensor histidine kinase [Kiloniellales bacterium]
MAQVERETIGAPAVSRGRIRPLGQISRSLVGKFVLLLLVFVAVPIILYAEFRQADADKRALLLQSVRAQGHFIAESLRPLLQREGTSTLPALNEAIKPFATPPAGIKVLYRPAGETGLESFFFVASDPPVPAATLEAERDKLMERGVLDKLSQSCQGQLSMALRHRKSSGEEELLTSITPITTEAGCWAIITTHTAREMLGTAIDQPYWKTIEVRVAAVIYLAMAIFTIGLFFSIWRGLMRFRELAHGISSGRGGDGGFATQNQVPELASVAEEFDRMTMALRDSADSIRRAAEDNAHAFKTPIAIMRQSLAPLTRLVPEDNPRGRRALEVIEESVDRLDHLVSSARRLDQATAELLDPPRQEIDLSHLFARMLDAYAGSLASHGLHLESDLDPNIIIRAGEDLMETVIENVMDNAIEVAPRGTAITVALKRMSGVAVLAVCDRGPGVAPEDVDRIFERYVSLRGPRNGEPAGNGVNPGEEAGGRIGPHLGIGLWIVRRNLQAIGGNIRAENRPGGGLAVVMGLPVAGQDRARHAKRR